MKLSDRLLSVVRFIPPGSRVVDIGTDHALLPIYLVRNNICTRVIAGDLKEGPLKAAYKNVKAAGLADEISTRLGFGLSIIEPGEVDVAVIAGMGGSTIKSVIEQAGKDLDIEILVLQPMADSGFLRKWLTENGWRIRAEDLIKEDERIYEVICAVPGEEKNLDKVLIEIGPRLYEKKHPLLGELLEAEINKLQDIIISLEKSNSRSSELKRKEIVHRVKQLEMILNDCKMSDSY